MNFLSTMLNVKTIIKYVFIIVVIFWTLAPFIWLIVSSISTKMDLTSFPPRWIPQNPTLENYQEILFGGKYSLGELFRFGTMNSLLISITSTFFALILGIPTAYSLSRFKFRGSVMVFITTLLTQIIPPITIAIPLYMIWMNLQLLDTYQGLISIYTAFILPFVTWILYGYFQAIPKELDEAAIIDGCSRIGAIFRIILPLSAPGIAATVIFCFIVAWNEFFYALIFTAVETKTLPIVMAEFLTKHGSEYTKLAASGVIASIPPVAIALIFQKYIISGLVRGALKA
jgi:multiple sugar transport system permease protein